MKIENIKFKAKRLDGKGWAIGDLLHSYENGAIIVPIEGGGAFSVDHSTVCQFTGLKDCEGNEVWEGDILEGNRKAEIFFAQGAFLIRSIDDNGKETLHSLFNYIEWNGKIMCRVVGNKFDKEK